MDQQTPYEMTSMRPEMRYETQPIFPEVDEDKTKTNKSSEHKVIPPRKVDDDDDDKFILFPFLYFTMTTILTLVEMLKENFVYFTKCPTK